VQRVLSLALLLAACEADTLAFDLVMTAPGCAASSFEQVSYIEIAVYGEHDGERCVLDQRCLWDVDELAPLEDVDDFADAMRAANEPLVSGLREGAQHIEVNGRDSDCYLNASPSGPLPDHPMCGGNDFDEVDDGELPVVLTCAADRCPRKEVPLCP
jgi:hypothetical protein